MNEKENLESNVGLEKDEALQLTRRDALKVLSISPMAALLLSREAHAEEAPAAKSNSDKKIVIVGGGTAGIMLLSRVRKALSNPNVTIIAPNEAHLYQPGQVFIAAGEMTMEDIILENSNYIPDDVTWIKDEVSTFDPDNNKVTTNSGKEVEYDYLLVATGLEYNYEFIEGLTKEMIGTKGIASVYLNDPVKGTAEGAIVTHQWFIDLKEAAKNGTPKVIATQPHTPIKCGGAPQKILYLSDDYLKLDGLTADFKFCTNGGKLFGIPEINEALFKVQKGYGNIENKFKHNLVKIDADKKIATFKHTYQVKGEYDKDLEEYDMITKEEMVALPYDFIHIVPPMQAVKAVRESPLAWQKGSAKGWLELDRYTLQHRRYPNVFGAGDVAGVPKGKTGGTARKQGPVVVENLVAVMEGKKPTAKFGGYTVCPLKPEYGEIIMAEFNYDGLAPSIPFLDPATPRYFWWAFDLYAIPPMYKYLMLNGYM